MSEKFCIEFHGPIKDETNKNNLKCKNQRKVRCLSVDKVKVAKEKWKTNCSRFYLII